MTKNQMFLRMVTASFLRRKSRMFVALLAVAVGATILSGLVTIYVDVPRQMGAQFRNYGANMIFTPEKDFFTYEDMKNALSVIAKNELVGASPFAYKSVRLHEQPVLACAVDMESVKKTSPYWLVEGSYPENKNQILLGKNIAENLLLKTGDKSQVFYTPQNKEESDLILDFTVSGILNTGGKEENFIYLTMDGLSALCGEDIYFDLAEVSISTSQEKLKAYLEKINTGNFGLYAKLVKRVTSSESSVLGKLQALVLLVTVIVLALTMICVGTTMGAVVSERRTEIALKKAIGSRDRDIIKEFTGEAVLLGFTGGLAGVILGFLFANFVSVHVFSSYIVLRVTLVPVTIIASIAVTAVASLFPIKNATKVEPALVLKGE